MIKNLLNADEDPPPGTKVIIEDTLIDPPLSAQNSESAGAEENAANSQTHQTSEVPESAEASATPFDSIAETARREDFSEAPKALLDEDSESLAALTDDIEHLDDKELDLLEEKLAAARVQQTVNEPVQPSAEDVKAPVFESFETKKTDDLPSDTIFQSSFTPPSTAETIRNSGLAWSAGVVLFGSVIFMMILGWFADLLLGSSPFGLVGGIVLGGLIGIIQLFRITSQIYRK